MVRVVGGVFLMLAVGARVARAEGAPDELVMSVGAFDFQRGEVETHDTRAAFSAEYRAGLGLWVVKPFLGFLATTSGSLLGYGGVLAELPIIADEIFVTPSIALAGFRPDASEDLGSTMVFRTGVEVSHPVHELAWVGLSYFHVSNGGLSDHNPGAESLVMSISRALDW
jgi:lipid A 3-O-deacylase